MCTGLSWCMHEYACTRCPALHSQPLGSAGEGKGRRSEAVSGPATEESRVKWVGERWAGKGGDGGWEGSERERKDSRDTGNENIESEQNSNSREACSPTALTSPLKIFNIILCKPRPAIPSPGVVYCKQYEHVWFTKGRRIFYTHLIFPSSHHNSAISKLTRQSSDSKFLHSFFGFCLYSRFLASIFTNRFAGIKFCWFFVDHISLVDSFDQICVDQINRDLLAWEEMQIHSHFRNLGRFLFGEIFDKTCKNAQIYTGFHLQNL